MVEVYSSSQQLLFCMFCLYWATKSEVIYYKTDLHCCWVHLNPGEEEQLQQEMAVGKLLLLWSLSAFGDTIYLFSIADILCKHTDCQEPYHAIKKKVLCHTWMYLWNFDWKATLLIDSQNLVDSYYMQLLGTKCRSWPYVAMSFKGCLYSRSNQL